MSIVIIDYGMGNIQSVYNAFEYLGVKVKVSSSPRDIAGAAKIVLPGVGAFDDTMRELASRGLRQAIIESIRSGKPYLGLCLGLQILFDTSAEGTEKGLSVLSGKVVRFGSSRQFKVPHMGWNTLSVADKFKNDPIFGGIDKDQYFYFVHSYYAMPDERAAVAGSTPYGGVDFASMVVKDNIYAMQFHPEKSQKAGLRMLKNFCEMK